MRATAAAALLGLALLACNTVTFVDPAADLKARLQLGTVERLIVADDPRLYLHVPIGPRAPSDTLEGARTSTEGVVLSALTPTGEVQLPWADAVPSPCGGPGRCFAFTLGAGFGAPTHVVLRVPAIAHEVEAPVVVRRLGGYALEVAARAGNRQLRVDLVDPIRRFYSSVEQTGSSTVADGLPFPRAFEAHVAPGACGAPPAPDDPAWARLRALPALVPSRMPLDAPDPASCLWIRPAAPALGPPALGASAGARAVVARFRHVYTPPVELTPIVFVPLFDLEIPSEARCEEAEGLVLSAILEAATMVSEATGAEVLALPPLEIAEADGTGCVQTDARRFDAVALHDRTVAAVRAAFGEAQEVRILWIYAQNLDLPLPNAIDSAIGQLRGLTSAPYEDFLFTLAPDRISDELQPDRHLEWLATEEPLFRSAIAGVLRGLWPFTTMLHSNDAAVRLTSEADAARFEAFRVCDSNRVVTPIGDRVQGPFGVTDVFVPDAAGPAFRVPLVPQRLLPTQEVLVPSVSVTWEGCEAFCDRPAPDGDARLPWREAQGC